MLSNPAWTVDVTCVLTRRELATLICRRKVQLSCYRSSIHKNFDLTASQVAHRAGVKSGACG